MATPTFNNRDKTKSSWTNSVTRDNGGTKVDVIAISHSALGENTITLSYKLIIHKWGRHDVVMELDLDDIVTIS